MSHRWDPYRSPGPLTLPVRPDPTGRTGPTPGEARGPHWRKTSRGFYVPASVPAGSAAQRVAEAAPLAHSGAVTGWASLLLQGGAFFDGESWPDRRPLPIPIVLPGRKRRPRPGVDFSQDRLAPHEVVVVHGIPCTRTLRATFDTARTAPNGREALVALEMSIAAGLASVHHLGLYLQHRSGWAGVEQVRAAWGLATGRSRSPQEVRGYLIWVQDTCLPPPLVNAAVYGPGGQLLGYPDLLEPTSGLVLEYDGDDHRSARRHSDDVDREALFRSHGLEVTRATGRDTREPRRLARRLEQAYRRALLPRPRHWQLGPGRFGPQSSP